MLHTLPQNVLQNDGSGSMKYVQNIRGKWTIRMAVPEELRHIIGRNELVQIGLPDNAKAREKMAVGVVNAFQAQLHEAREVWDSLREASIPTLSTAAKSTSDPNWPLTTMNVRLRSGQRMQISYVTAEALMPADFDFSLRENLTTMMT